MDDAPVVLPTELTPAQVRPVVYRVISKKHGLNLKSAALTVLSRFLGHHFGPDWRGPEAERSLDEISRKWKDEDRGIFVDGPPLAQVIRDWLNAEAATRNTSQGTEAKFEWRQYFKVVNATEQRKFVYDFHKKNFEVGADPLPKPFGNASSLTNVFASRYHILLDKLFRNELFQPSGMALSHPGGMGGETSYTISPIKNMLGRTPGSEFFLFGLLEKQEDGPWTLYDPTSNVALEFTEHTVFAPDHYYTSGSFVLCHGHFLGNSFQVATLGPPPPERREQSLEAYGSIDFYGLNSSSASGNRVSQRTERIDPGLGQIMLGEEQKMLDNRIVVLGADLFLDQLNIVDALRRTLLELNKNPPIALVLPGSFISAPFQPYMATQDGRNAAQVYRDGMNSLADILAQCPELTSNSKIILVPGPNDPWHASSISVLPFQPLPQIFTGRVERAGNDIVLASNPTRLCYLTHEFVLFRSNMGEKLRAHSIDTEALTRKSVETSSSKTNRSGKLKSAAAAGAGELSSLQQSTEAAVSLLTLDDDAEKLSERAAIESMIQNNDILNPGQQEKIAINDSDESRRVFATLLDQCHLSPFAMSKSPVLWEYDQALSLAQWPTALVVIDPTTPGIKQVYEECNVMNPGPFWNNGRANWLELWPSSGNFKFCEIF